MRNRKYDSLIAIVIKYQLIQSNYNYSKLKQSHICRLYLAFYLLNKLEKFDFYNKFCSQNKHIINTIMKPVDINRKVKFFKAGLRPSQSLHTRFFKSSTKQQPSTLEKTNTQEINVFIIFKKKKIQFQVKNKTPFKELNRLLYSQMHKHLIQEYQTYPERVSRVLQSIVGFQSVDGDINFDYRLSLQRGVIQKTKFFYPFFKKSSSFEEINYKIYNCLAIGGFSKVYLARSYENGQFYAIKFIKKGSINGSLQQQRDKYQSMRNQIAVGQQLNHPFLIKLMHAFQTEHFYCMVFQYCPGGQLFFLLKRFKIMDQNMAKFYFLQILYGIQYMHSKSILYRDLKPQNILLDHDGNCKIVDFGLSKKIDSRTKTFSYCGSAQYMAPQMILRTGHSFGIDYYSLGALLYQLVTGLPPFYTKNHNELQQSIICKELTFPSHIQLSSEIKDFLSKLLKKEEKQRLGSYIGVKQIIFHPWVGRVKSAAILSKQIKAPFIPNLLEYNFDTSQLGDDQAQFTQLVIQDTKSKHCIRNEYFKNIILSSFQNEKAKQQLKNYAQSMKQNMERTRIHDVLKMKKDLPRQKSKDSFKSLRVNMLERIDKRSSKEKLRLDTSTDGKRTLEICKLSPYLNYKKASPQKQKQLMSFIQQKIIKIERGSQHRTLKKMKIQRNRIEIDHQ